VGAGPGEGLGVIGDAAGEEQFGVVGEAGVFVEGGLGREGLDAGEDGWCLAFSAIATCVTGPSL